jgi:hypothetical protein
MFGFNRKFICVGLTFLFSISFIGLCAESDVADRRERLLARRNGLFNPYWGNSKRLDWLEEKRSLRDISKEIKEEIKALRAAGGEENKDEIEWLEKDLVRIQSILEGSLGDIWLRGLAGKEWERVEDLRVGNDWKEGLNQGLMFKLSNSISNALGDSIDLYIGKIFNGVLGQAEEWFSNVYRYVFHSACKEFTTEEIENWKKLIGNDLLEIDRMLKNAERNDSRGKVEILREYESEDGVSQTISLWQDFVEDIINTCEELAKEIDMRKGYYKKSHNDGFGVVNCASRLKNKLWKIRTWLLSVSSLKEFANTPEVKSIIPAMKKSLDNYFINLSDQVKTKHSPKVSVAGSRGGASSTRRDTWRDRDDGLYPEMYN